jgi:hypothetical protein
MEDVVSNESRVPLLVDGLVDIEKSMLECGLSCYSASSERKLLLHKLMCIVMSAVVIALCRAIKMVCLHDVSMISIGVEDAD